MGISRIYMNRLAILTVLVALLMEMTVAANGVTHIQQNSKVSITGVNSTGMDHLRDWALNPAPLTWLGNPR